MSRRHAAEKRKVLPDPKYGDLVITRLMNRLMLDGKKSVAEKIVYGAFDDMEKKLAEDFRLLRYEEKWIDAWNLRRKKTQ